MLIMIPAYNEEGNIERVVNNLIENYPQFDYIVINDGSMDKTKEICRNNHFEMIDQPVNLGLSGTFHTGLKYAREHDYDAAIQFDGDGQHRAEYIQMMADKMEEGYNVVIGSRFVTEKKPRSLRMAGSNLIAFLIRMIDHTEIHDPTSGMRMFDRKTIRFLADGYNLGPEPDTIAYLIHNGAKVAEVQVKMDERIAGTSYLTFSRSIQYMATMCISILFSRFFRKNIRWDEV